MARKLSPPKPASRFESEGAGLDTILEPVVAALDVEDSQEAAERPQEAHKAPESPQVPEPPVAVLQGPLVEAEVVPQHWRAGPPPPEPRLEGTKRLSLDIPASVHTRFKAACASTGRRMVTELSWWMEQRSAELEREAKRNRRR